PNTDRYLPEIYAKNLPQTGGLLMTTKTVNYEEIMRLQELGVDAYVDVGQEQAGLAETLDGFTETSGLASVFVSQNSLSEIPESYRKIGEILGDTGRGNELYAYTKGWADTITDGMKTVDGSGMKKSALHIVSIDGNKIFLLGGFTEDGKYGYQGTVVNTLADNIVTAKSNKGFGDPYGMEELLNILEESEPDVIFINGAKDHAYYNAFMDNPAFAELSAVKSGQVYESPYDCPYSWIPRPFSGWGISGFIWAANILYPDVFNYNVKDEIQKFYKVMIGYDLTDEEYARLTSTTSQASSPAPVAGILAGLAVAGIFLLRRKP
ncbi:MAG TPA: ABC transporter substrate-binding protein, partial [Methanocorpusculum sp.]|nr:ABC transporter substrate-binding protein [Methanocorpusculum sp.]